MSSRRAFSSTSIWSRLRAAGALAAGVLLAGCAQDPTRFAEIAGSVASSGSHGVEGAYRSNLAALVAHDGLDRLSKANGLAAGNPVAESSRKIREAKRRLDALASVVRRSNPAAAPGSPGSRAFEGEWRTARSELYLRPSGSSTGSGHFTFSSLQATRSEIRVLPVDGRQVRLRLQCDGAMTVDGPTGIGRHRAGEAFVVLAEAPNRTKGAVVLRPGAELNRCSALAEFADGQRAFEIRREERSRPDLVALDSRFDVCRAPPEETLTPLARVFYSERWLSQTCAFEPGRIEVLTDETEGFNAKVAALLGQPLPGRFFVQGNPEAPIDFSRAPRLSLIYVSYLDIKADFGGRVIDRLLRHHASKGTTIRIMTSAPLLHDKDRAMVEGLAADHLNVQLQVFAWKPPSGAHAGEALSRFHKVHHVKMLAALSTEPGRSVAIIGGRNIHDGFLFPDPVDLSGFPSLQNYSRRRGLTLNYYSNWRDLDVALHDDDAVRSLAAHLSTLWHDDAETAVIRPFSVRGGNGAVPAAATTRHFISVPYTDGRALEAYYVDLIDAARRRIEVVNPYLNLTPAIEAAIERALDRGVEITIVGRVDLEGDLGGNILTTLNGMFVNRYAGRIAIYDYKDPKILLHSKVLMIDGEIVVVSSVNLNNRSFIHDNENGIAVLDRAFYARMKKVFETYRSDAIRLEAADASPLWRLLLRSRILREAM